MNDKLTITRSLAMPTPTKTTHTPGPWTWKQDNPATQGIIHIYGTPARPGLEIATLYDGKALEGIANARLIAAAPALVEALEFMMASLPSRDGRFMPHSMKEPLRRAEAALAQARGEGV